MVKKRGMTIQISPAPNRSHSKMCRDFWKNFQYAFLDVSSYILDEKNSKKNFQIFSFFIGGPLQFFLKVFYEFHLKILELIWEKNEWKNLKKFVLNFFHPKYSLGHPKMHIGSFFQKSLHILECLLFGAGEIWIVMPLLKCFWDHKEFYVFANCK